MLRKEFQEVFKQSLYYLAVAAGISLVIKIISAKHVGSYLEVFYLTYQFSLLVFAAFMGISLFLSDKKQRAQDYVLSLPYSRPRLLGIKVIPRLTVITVFYLLLLAIYLWGGEGFIMHEAFFTNSWSYWLLFFMGLSFSASADGYMKAAGLALVGMIVFLQLFYLVIYLAPLLKGAGESYIAGGILTLFNIQFNRVPVLFLVVNIFLFLPFIIPFVLSYKKWGTYSKENYNKGYLKLFIPLMASGFIIATFFVYTIIGRGYSAYYLAEKQRLIETDAFSTRLVGSDGDVKLKYSQGNFDVFFEDERYVYGKHMTSESYSIVRIHKENHVTDTLLEVTGPGFRYSKYGIRVFKHILAVQEHYRVPSSRNFVFVDTRSKAVKKIKNNDVLPAGYFNPLIFGAGEDPANGKIFWLISSERSHLYPIIKLWEDGKAENLGIMSRAFPVYINRLLITTANGELVFSKITKAGPEVVREIRGYRYKRITFPGAYARVDLNPTTIKEYYCFLSPKSGGRSFVRLDLETFEISHIDKILKKPRQSFFTYSGRVYKIQFETDENEADRWKRRYYLNKIYRLEGKKFVLLKEFPAVENKVKGDSFWVSKNGVVIKRSNKLSIYSFPDMKPLTIKI